MAVWFVFDGVAERGPFSEDEFFAFLKDKDPAQIVFWREGLDAWVPAKSIPALAAMMKPAAQQSAASPVLPPAAPAPADITVTAGDHFAQADDDEDAPLKESKWLWALYGAGVGLAWALLSTVIGGNPLLALWSTEVAGAPLVLISIKVLGLTIVGFAAGCVRDAFRKDAMDEATATGSPAPANENQPLSGDAAKAA